MNKNNYKTNYGIIRQIMKTFEENLIHSYVLNASIQILHFGITLLLCGELTDLAASCECLIEMDKTVTDSLNFCVTSFHSVEESEQFNWTINWKHNKQKALTYAVPLYLRK